MAVDTDTQKFEKLVKDIEGLSILEIAQFGKFLQERWGVSAAPVAVAAAAGAQAGGAAAAEAAEEKTEFTVILKEAGASKINVINRALGGRSSRTFLTGGQWERVRSQLKPGDIDWKNIFKAEGARWFHCGGIFAALFVWLLWEVSWLNGAPIEVSRCQRGRKAQR